jgi:hypothetical protein
VFLTRFCRLFLLNETTRFGQNGAVSCTVHVKKKQKDPNGAVLKGTVGLLLPLDVRGRGRRSFFIDFSVPLSLKSIKKTPTINPLV